MDSQNALSAYELAYKIFCDCIISLPEALFLSPMNGWSPRDVVAHLIGWNWLMIEASAAILRGETPAYYADAPSDYRNINAGFVSQYASRSKTELLEELRSSMEEFEGYVQTLDQGKLTDSRWSHALQRAHSHRGRDHQLTQWRLPGPFAPDQRMAS